MKQYKHDYASLRDKVRYKLRTHLITPKSRKLWLYPAWYHLKIHGKTSGEDMTGLYITQRGHLASGIGVCFEGILSGYAVSRALGVNYAYSHLPDDALDIMLSMGEGEQCIEDLKRGEYRKVQLPYFSLDDRDDISFMQKLISSYRGEKILFYLEDQQCISNTYYLEQREFVSDKFWNSRVRNNDPIIFDEKRQNVVLHIRRGDAGEYVPNKGMEEWWLSEEYYINVLSDLFQNEIKTDSTDVFIVSEGIEEHFGKLVDYLASNDVNYKFVLNETNSLSWLYMIKADVLLTGTSSYSFNAALFNRGLKISPQCRFVYPKDEKWLVANRDGTIKRNNKSGDQGCM